jgi:glycerol-3-phosphate acyltransferase PlsX
MRIALDAMGGDFAPREVVRGAITYAASHADEVILVGDVPRLEAEIAAHGHGRPASVTFVDAPEVIAMGESPASALRTKRRASVRVATDLVRDGRADAVVSAGSTGATMASAVFRLGRVAGIDRPALGAHLVTATGPIMLLDVGANVDSDATNLVHFAVMGSIYAERVLHVPRPRVGLLNIGEEPEKGNGLMREAHERLREAELNFIGNVEANDLIYHAADVVVTDGFIGNVVVKLFEGLTSYIFRSLRTDLQQGPVAPLALLALKPGFDRMRHRFDYERYGGVPLLGVRGVSIVTHGRARARMIENALRVASEAASARIPEQIAQWTREHPALARDDGAEAVVSGTRPLTDADARDAEA